MKDLAKKKIDASGSYDTKSVMHYVATAFAIKGKQTLVPAKKGVKVPTKHNGVPSSKDITRLCKMYPAQCKKGGKKKAEDSQIEEEIENEEIEEIEVFEETEELESEESEDIEEENL